MEFVKMKTTGICSIFIMITCGALAELEDQMQSSLIKKLTAVCGKDGIKVSVRFNEPFSGIVYSDGYYDKPQCVYINQENYTSAAHASEETRFSFLVPGDECGTVFHDPGSSLSSQLDDNSTKLDKNELVKANEVYMENTIMFQKNHFIQEQGDILQKLRCVWQKEIRRPLHATLPLRGKVNIQKSNHVKVVRPKGSLNYRKVSDKQKSNFEHDQQITHPTSKVKGANHRYSSLGRKRFQPIGQVESISPFSSSRRSGKSLDYEYLPSPENSLPQSANLPNLTALPYKQDDISRSSGSITSGFNWDTTHLIMYTMIMLQGMKDVLFKGLM